MLKKVAALLLGLTLVAASVTGCGSGDQPSTEQKEESQKEESKQEESPAGDAQKDDTAEKEQPHGDPVKLRFVMYGEAGARNTELFQNELHDKLMEDLNIELSIDYVPWGAKDQIATMLASGEKMAFMSNLTSQFASWVQSGYVASLDEDMVKEVAPDYLASRMGKTSFEASKVNGTIYMLPMGCTTFCSLQDNFSIRNDILNEVGWDVDKIHTYDDLVAAMKAVHEAKPDLALIKDVKHLKNALDSVYGNGQMFAEDIFEPGMISLADDRVFSWFESEEFKNLCHLEEELFDLGFITVEHVTDQPSYENAWNSGNCLTSFGSTSSLYNHNFNGVENPDVRYLKLDDNPFYLVKDYDWAWSVSSADQDNVGNYLKLFNWIYESKENYMLALYGVEGTDYNINEYGEVDRTTTDGFIYDWMHSTPYYQPISSEKYDAAEVEEFMNLDNNALLTNRMGFIFDVSPVETEYTMLLAIIQEKVTPIAYGIGDYDTEFPAVLQELKDAGLDKYIEEYQKQYEAFVESKK